MEEPTTSEKAASTSDEPEAESPLYNARDHESLVCEATCRARLLASSLQFCPIGYLNDFYKSAKEDEAMTIILFFLPGILYRLPPRLGTALDLGAGPTVYMQLALRNRVDNFWTSDFAEASRAAAFLAARKVLFNAKNLLVGKPPHFNRLGARQKRL